LTTDRIGGVVDGETPVKDGIFEARLTGQERVLPPMLCDRYVVFELREAPGGRPRSLWLALDGDPFDGPSELAGNHDLCRTGDAGVVVGRRCIVLFEGPVKLDTLYIRNRSHWLILQPPRQTFPALMRGTVSYRPFQEQCII